MKPFTWIALTAVVVAVIVGAPAPCGGQEPDEPTVVVKQGEPAPFMGLLVSETEYTRLIGDRLELQELRAKLRACQQEGTALEKMYLSKLEVAAKPVAWYGTASFNRWFGFTLGVATAGLAVWGASELPK